MARIDSIKPASKQATPPHPKKSVTKPSAPPQPPEDNLSELHKPHAAQGKNNFFAWSLILIGVGLLVLGLLAIMFLPSLSESWLILLGTFGFGFIIVGLAVDAIYRKGHNKA